MAADHDAAFNATSGPLVQPVESSCKLVHRVHPLGMMTPEVVPCALQALLLKKLKAFLSEVR